MRLGGKIGLNPPQQVVNVTKAYFEEQDLIGQWIEDCCILEANAWTSTTALHNSYAKWFEERRMRPQWINSFSTGMEEKQFVKERPRKDGNNTWGFNGIRLANNTDDTPPVGKTQSRMPF